MKMVYSTRGVSGDRASLWRDVIRKVYAHLEIDVAPSAHFSGELTRARLGQIEITDVRVDSETAHRTRRHISRAATDSLIYLLVKQGQLTVTQFGRTCAIRQGEYALLDLDEPYEFQHAERVQKVGLKLPRELLRRSGAEIALNCAIPHSAASGISRLAADYISGLTAENVEMAGANNHLLSRTASDLVFLSLETNCGAAFADETAVRAAIRRRASNFIEQHFALANLRPEQIAQGIGVSVRYLHQCFEASEFTLMQQLKRARLERAFADLEDVTMRLEPINRIAFRNGFRNVCHFNESFKTHFGLTPRELRSRKSGSL